MDIYPQITSLKTKGDVYVFGRVVTALPKLHY